MAQPATASTIDNNGNLLVVQDLIKYFPLKKGVLQRVFANVRAVDGVTFAIKKGETLGLVGESGCGKTTVGRTILRLIPATSGSVVFEGRVLFSLRSRDLKLLRRDMQIIFQDPFYSLDPRVPIGESIAEGPAVHGMGSRQERQDAVIEMLAKVQLRSDHARRYPHEFSGGQRQRIGIARALIMRPKFIVCDEPVSALDVSVQSQVLNILMDLQQEFGLTYLFIAHDLSVVEHISDRVAVMYLGNLVELTASGMLYEDPLHPYTEALLSAVPRTDPDVATQRIVLPGDVPSPADPPPGCKFHPRCRYAQEVCSTEDPEWHELDDDHWVACHLADELNLVGIDYD
jgi:peptide/nickel transport system ATP-binding protein/oligopeptide transport system ATP-binding protein